ncbi:hypothetical protein AHAS_Ahas20G0177800 [Arachis hypogaea]
MANPLPDSINHGICGHVSTLNCVIFLLLISLYVVLCCFSVTGINPLLLYGGNV